MAVNDYVNSTNQPNYKKVTVTDLTPTSNSELTSKQYVDSVSGGGGSSPVSITETADSTGLNVFEGVAYDSSGNITKADSSDDDLSKAVGVTKQNISSSSSGVFIQSGIITGLTGLTARSYYYLQDDGSLSTIPPSTGYVVQMGYAPKSTQFIVDIKNRIKLA